MSLALPEAQFFTEIDWAATEHAVCVLDAAGTIAAQFTIKHSAEGIASLVRRLARPDGREDRACCSGRLLSARLPGIALRHARWGGLTEAEKASGAAELRKVAGDRGDLLAVVAGLAIGSAKRRGPEYEARGQAVAELCRMAGADEALIPQWIQEGRGRAEAAQLPPFSRPCRAPRRPSPRPALRASGAASHQPLYPGPSRLIRHSAVGIVLNHRIVRGPAASGREAGSGLPTPPEDDVSPCPL